MFTSSKYQIFEKNEHTHTYIYNSLSNSCSDNATSCCYCYHIVVSVNPFAAVQSFHFFFLQVKQTRKWLPTDKEKKTVTNILISFTHSIECTKAISNGRVKNNQLWQTIFGEISHIQ